MKYTILILITSFFTSCGFRSYSYLADPIIASYSKEMKMKKGYLMDATGGCIPNGDLRHIHMFLLQEKR